MGMFNSLIADLICPLKDEISKDCKIQIKWQKREARDLSVYHKSDILNDILDEYNNNWIRTDYICTACSQKTSGKNGYKFIKTDDQQRHHIFIKIEDGQIKEILTEKEFNNLNIKNFVDY